MFLSVGLILKPLGLSCVLTPPLPDWWEDWAQVPILFELCGSCQSSPNSCLLGQGTCPKQSPWHCVVFILQTAQRQHRHVFYLKSTSVGMEIRVQTLNSQMTCIDVPHSVLLRAYWAPSACPAWHTGKDPVDSSGSWICSMCSML